MQVKFKYFCFLRIRPIEAAVILYCNVYQKIVLSDAVAKRESCTSKSMAILKLDVSRDQTKLSFDSDFGLRRFINL